VKPGRVVGADARPQAPHIAVIVFARGMLSHAFTRVYFSDEADANAEDAVLSTVEPGRRHSLIATREDTPGATLYRFDVRLQGEGETVFFDA
jgi:protocatechuate 3,4-dioxygenase alpha subunit